MKKVFFAFLILGLVFSYYSCDELTNKDDEENVVPSDTTKNDQDDTTDDKDDDDDGGSNLPHDPDAKPNPAGTLTDTNPLQPGSASTLTPEQHKDNLAATAKTLIEEMGDLTLSQAAEAALNLAYILDELKSSPLKSTAATSSVLMVADLANGKATPNEVLFSLRKLMIGDVGPDTEIEQEYLDEVAGTYTWNESIQDFDFISGPKLIAKWPATSSSTSNDAVFTVEEFAWSTSPVVEEGVPTSIKANLKVGSTTAMSLVATASYNADGIPTEVSATLTIDTYIFKATVKNDNYTNLTAEYSLKHGSTTVMSLSANLSGSFSESNIESQTIYVKEVWDDSCYCWKEVESTEDDPEAWEKINADNIFGLANATFQFLEIKLVGSVAINTLIRDMDKIDWDLDEESVMKKQAEVFNKNANFWAAYTVNDKVIGQLNFYADNYSDSYTYCWWDYNGSEYVEVCDEVTEEYWDMKPEFVFSDNSTLNPDEYFNEGFGSVFDEINLLIKDLNTKYGAYMDGEEIPEIDPNDM